MIIFAVRKQDCGYCWVGMCNTWGQGHEEEGFGVWLDFVGFTGVTFMKIHSHLSYVLVICLFFWRLMLRDIESMLCTGGNEVSPLCSLHLWVSEILTRGIIYWALQDWRSGCDSSQGRLPSMVPVFVRVGSPATLELYATPTPQILLLAAAETSPAHLVPWLWENRHKSDKWSHVCREFL